MAFTPTVTTAAGKPVDVGPIDPDEVNRKFDAAMADDTTDELTPQRRAAASEAEKPKRRYTRKPKEEKSRTVDAAPKVDVKTDYTADAQQVVGGVWTVAASISVTQPYALILETNADALVSALAEGAKHNASIRAFVSTGESSWMLGLASVTIGMGLQAWQMMKDPELRAQAAAVTREHLKEAIGAKSIQVQDTADVPAEA
jgi:hypothetical protein